MYGAIWGRKCVKEGYEVRRLVLAVFALVVLLALVGVGRELIVTTTADSGRGSLRWALLMARPGDVIKFDPTVFPPDDPATIYPLTELPPITCGGVTIDASDAGVIIDGSRCQGDWNNGLQVYSSDNVVMGLQIVNFKGSGIAVCGRNTHNNVIGGDRSIGIGPIGQGNLVSGNTIGIDVCDFATGNVIKGNIVGTAVSGQVPWGNKQSGIWVEDGVTRTVIGPHNIIAYNNIGIEISGSDARHNTITCNSIYANREANIVLHEGANEGIQPPQISGFDPLTNEVYGEACPHCLVEVYSGGHGECRFYETSLRADSSGNFTFVWPVSATNLALLVTDSHGNSSVSTTYSDVPMKLRSLQRGATNILRFLHPKPSEQLQDNRIGTMLPCLRRGDEDAAEWIIKTLRQLGMKWNHIYFDPIEPWREALTEESAFSLQDITPAQQYLVEGLLAHDIKICYIIEYWDESMPEGKQRLGKQYSRFRSNAEIQSYIDHVRFITRSLRGKVEWYEILNEPEVRMHWNWVRVQDYLRLVRQTIPVIREEDPGAKIVIGATSNLVYPEPREYLFQILRSDVVADADVISFHPMFGASPTYAFYRDYYYHYPELVREIRQTAITHGFSGDLMASEMCWRTSLNVVPNEPWTYSDVVAGKYYARGILINLGMGIITGVGGEKMDRIRPVVNVLKHLCTAMAGHEAIDMPVEVDIDYPGPVAYCSFRYPNGDRMLAIWTDGIAQDEDPGVPATIEFPSLVASSVTGIDVLHGFQQELTFEVEGDTTVVRNVLVKDYPVLIRLRAPRFGPDYKETVGDGFHRFGDVNAVSSGASGESDRDGDGVPDSKDYCPDWPGSKESNGC